MMPVRVLVVEDDRVVARDIQMQLRRIGHEVVGYTARGDDAASLALQMKADLVLMDIRLEGELDGIEAAQEIRNRCRLPVVFLTAYADDETVQRASVTEPFGYLLKPFEDSQLRTVLEMAIYKHGAERKLRESERRYATTLSSIGDAVIATDDQAIITFMNPSAELLTGWVGSSGLGRHIDEVFVIINEVTREKVDDPVAKVLRLGITVGLANHTILVARDKREIPIDDCGSPIVDDMGQVTGAVLVFRDMTERHKVEENLRMAQQELAHMGRVKAIGELTVSIAHEINQPLMAIVTNAAACLSWLSPSGFDVEEARHAALRIVKDGERAGEVIASIRALAKKSDATLTALDLNTAILEVLVLLQGELRRVAISTETELSPTPLSIAGDRVQLQQLILNLVVNAIDAISVAKRPLRKLNISSIHDGAGSVMVTVSDNGAGIDESLQSRVFEAFFTTKPDGIGMGLSICRTIVDAHGGRLWCSPNVSDGCSFHFTIPALVEVQCT